MKYRENVKPTDLYQGINSLTGGLMPGKIVSGGIRKGGSDSVTLIDCCMSSEQLSRAVTTGMSFELGIGPFSFGVETSSSHEFSSSTFTAYVYISSIFIDGEKSEENPTIPDKALPKNEEEANHFTLRNGDAYVSSISKGASYHAIYSFTFSSIEEKNKEEVKAGLDGIVKFVSFGAELNQKIEDFKQRFNASSTLLQRIHGPAGMEHPATEKMGEFARDFPKIAKEKKEFETLNWGISLNETANRKLIGGPFQQVIKNRKTLVDKIEVFSALKEQNNELNLMARIYKRYSSKKYPNGYTSDDQLTQILKASNEAMNKVASWINSFKENPTHKIIIEEKFPVLRQGYPILEIEVKDHQRFGNPRAEENFNPLNILYGGYKGFIRKFAKVNGISVVKEGKYIPSDVDTSLATLSMKFDAGDAVFYAPKGGGTDIKAVSSRIARISGKAGSYVDSLYFHANGQAIGDGGPGGQQFDFTIPEDYFFLYLRGYHGAVLDWFAPVIAKFKNASWERI